MEVVWILKAEYRTDIFFIVDTAFIPLEKSNLYSIKS